MDQFTIKMILFISRILWSFQVYIPSVKVFFLLTTTYKYLNFAGNGIIRDTLKLYYTILKLIGRIFGFQLRFFFCSLQMFLYNPSYKISF